MLLALVALGALAVLASGLNDVAFRPGQVIGQSQAETVSIPVAQFVEQIANISLGKQILVWMIVFLIVLIISTILSPELRRRVIKGFLQIATAFWAFYFLSQYFQDFFASLSLGNLDLTRNGADSSAGVPAPVFVPPEVSFWLVLLISLGVAAAMVAMIFAFNRWWKRRQAILALQRPLDDLARIARSSLDELSAGRAWDDVIVDCYVRMSGVVEKRRGLVRHYAMTPSEFAARLEMAGLPGDAVRRLTRLFESVRYGARKSTDNEINEAVTCLTSILHYFGETI